MNSGAGWSRRPPSRVRRASSRPFTTHSPMRRSRWSERKASASARRSSVWRDSPSIAPSWSIAWKPLPRSRAFDQALDLRLLDAGDLAEAEAHGAAHEPLRLLRGLQRAIPVAVVDVDRAQLDAVLARVAHELGRLVEAHRLAVEDRGAEHVRIDGISSRPRRRRGSRSSRRGSRGSRRCEKPSICLKQRSAKSRG